MFALTLKWRWVLASRFDRLEPAPEVPTGYETDGPQMWRWRRSTNQHLRPALHFTDWGSVIAHRSCFRFSEEVDLHTTTCHLLCMWQQRLGRHQGLGRGWSTSGRKDVTGLWGKGRRRTKFRVTGRRTPPLNGEAFCLAIKWFALFLNFNTGIGWYCFHLQGGATCPRIADCGKR